MKRAMRSRIRTAVVGGAVAVGLLLAGFVVGPASAWARDLEDCQMWWGQAVRSYLTQNRTQGPEDEVFKPACEIEAKGDKDGARIEAIMIGVRALAKLDQKGCGRFMGLYIGAGSPEEICMAATGEDMEKLREIVLNNLPPRPVAK